MNIKYDLSGKRFGLWTVLERAPNKNGRVYWKCICDCGTERDVLAQNLQNGSAQSCGCLNRKKASLRMKCLRKRLGQDRDYDSETRLYTVWQNMKKRCSEKDKTGRYFKRGISYTKEWETYKPFMEWALTNGYSDDLTLDRIDNDGNYCPENCRWVNRIVQARNKSSNRLVFYQGEMRSMAEVAELTGLGYATLKDRVNRGNSLDAPLRKRKKIRFKHKLWTKAELAREYGVSKNTIAYRIKKGIPIDSPPDEEARMRALGIHRT